MALQLSIAARDAALDILEVAVGVNGLLRIFDGPPPASCSAAESGNVLATIILPNDWMSAAASGVKSKLSTWEDTSADVAGKPSHFRVYDAAGVTCHLQGIACGPWTALTSYAIGDHVLNGGNVYRCTTGGISASSGGPSGTGSGIVDGVAQWTFIQAGADMTLSLGSFGVGADFQVTQFDITAGGA